MTYIPEENMSESQINRKLKSIEKTLIGPALSEKVGSERNNRNKSSYVWFSDEHKGIESVKLEIGSSVRPHPYRRKVLKSYVHEHLEAIEAFDAIREYQLVPVEVNVLDIERTFVDKLFSVKRHAICGTLPGKVRHIYDVVQLFKMPEIQKFLQGHLELKEIIRLTKETDSVYLEKRDIPEEYTPLERYDFEKWMGRLNSLIKSNYETLHMNLLYTVDKQNFDEAITVFKQISDLLEGINE